MIIKYTDQNFTLEVTDDRGEPILAMRAENVQFEVDLAKAAINGHKLTTLINNLIKNT